MDKNKILKELHFFWDATRCALPISSSERKANVLQANTYLDSWKPEIERVEGLDLSSVHCHDLADIWKNSELNSLCVKRNVSLSTARTFFNIYSFLKEDVLNGLAFKGQIYIPMGVFNKPLWRQERRENFSTHLPQVLIHELGHVIEEIIDPNMHNKPRAWTEAFAHYCAEERLAYAYPEQYELYVLVNDKKIAKIKDCLEKDQSSNPSSLRDIVLNWKKYVPG